VVIDPASGKVEASIDLSALVPKDFFKDPEAEQQNVLNGIAWDAAGKRLFVTGKKWPTLYQIDLRSF
jgi:glutamine cyclotransferase